MRRFQRSFYMNTNIYEIFKSVLGIVYMHDLTPGWTHFGLLRNLLCCLHVISGVKLNPALKKGAKFQPGMK